MKVAIHGFTGTQRMWRGFPCHTLSVLGHHPDAPATGEESFTDEVERLVQLLPYPTQELIGYSLGARLSLAMALQAPSRVSKLTLIGGTPGLYSQLEQKERKEADRKWIELLRNDGIAAFVDQWESLPLWQSQSNADQVHLKIQREERLSHSPKQLAFAIQSLGTGATPPMWDMLHTLQIPVHLIVGSHDEKYLGIAEKMLSELPEGRLSIVNDAGHNPVFERPKHVLTLLKSSSN